MWQLNLRSRAHMWQLNLHSRARMGQLNLCSRAHMWQLSLRSRARMGQLLKPVCLSLCLDTKKSRQCTTKSSPRYEKLENLYAVTET